MLPRRLTIGLAATGLLLSACASADGTETGALRENVIEPGITAIDESKALTCSAEASGLRTALEAYELLKREPAPDQQALIDGGYLRTESELWDIVDGRLIPADPACGAVPATVPTAEIVTEPDDALPTVDDLFADFTDDEVASMGGPDCARQLAVVFAGASAFAVAEGLEPDTFEQVAAAGHFAEPVTAWHVVDDVIRPVDGSGCLDFVGDR